MRTIYSVIIYAVFMVTFISGCSTNAITGETQLMLISRDQELQIGRAYGPELAKQLGGEIQDPALQDYIQHVGRKVARVSHDTTWEYDFTALNDEMVNAFALPGGKVYITRGMLSKLSSEAQLAGILAHEVVHVVAQHSAQAMSREMAVDVALSVALRDSGRGTAQLAGFARQLIGMKYSRDNEREADTIGMDYLVLAGYNPYGMVETMQILEELGSESGSHPPEFLSTHPSPENRVGYLRTKIQQSYTNLSQYEIGKDAYLINVLDRMEVID